MMINTFDESFVGGGNEVEVLKNFDFDFSNIPVDVADDI